MKARSIVVLLIDYGMEHGMQTKGIVMQTPYRVDTVWHCALQSVTIANQKF